jgi:hypothetical protein
MVLFLDVIINFLGIKTKLYAKILTMTNKIIPYFVILFILLTPFCSFILLVNILNIICSNFTGTAAVNTVNEYSISQDLQEFGLNCINYSPMFYLIMCFVLQGRHFFDDKENSEQYIIKIQTALLRLKISLWINNITILMIMILSLIVFRFNTGVFKMKFIEFLKNYHLANIHSEDFIRVILIISLGIFYYIGILLISNTFMDEIVAYVSESDENNKLKRMRYRLLIFVPFMNMYVIYFINTIMHHKNLKFFTNFEKSIGKIL